MIAQLREGWTYVAGFAPIRTILLLFALLSLMGWPFMVLMPIFAAQVSAWRPAHARLPDGRGRRGLARFRRSRLVMRRSVRGLTKMIPIAAAAFGIGLICFGLFACSVALDADDASSPVSA